MFSHQLNRKQRRFNKSTLRYRLLLIFQALFLVPLLVVMTPMSAKAYTSTYAPSFVTKWGTAGSGNSQFSYPTDAAIDSSGNVYVVDVDNNRVTKFTSAGTYITKWGSFGSGNSQFYSPQGIAIDNSDNVYVVDTFNYRIQKFDSNGNYLTQWGSFGSADGQFGAILGVDVDTSGNVFVTDDGNNRVSEFTNTGTFIRKWGSTGAGNGQFNFPWGVVTDSSGNVYVSDASNNNVQKFNSTGIYVATIGSSGSGNGQLTYPEMIAIDSIGNLYVTDVSNSRIAKFDTSGNFLVNWGSAGTGNGQFSGDMGIAANSSGDVYVTDTNNTRVQKFSYPAVSNTFTNQPISGASANITLDTPWYTAITCANAVTEASLTTQDSGKAYPLGLVNFCLTVPSGSSIPVSLTFVTDLTTSQVTARKYNSNTHTYSDIAGATITDTTVSGQHALKLSYTVTDGGSLDMDGTANGAIVDPVGLAIADTSSATSALASTGDNTQLIFVAAGVFLATGISIGLISRKTRLTTISR